MSNKRWNPGSETNNRTVLPYYYMKFEWAPNDPGTCHNVDKWKVAAPGGSPYDWVLEPLAYYVDTNVPSGGVQLPSIGDATGVVRDIYLVVDLGEYLASGPAPILPYYDIDNGRCLDLPGYLIGITPVEFTPWDYEPFYTDPFTGRLWLDGDIWFWPGGASGTDRTSWGAIKALFR